MNCLVLSGTKPIVLSRTGLSCYQGPKAPIPRFESNAYAPLNYTNKNYYVILLTVVGRWRFGNKCALQPTTRSKRVKSRRFLLHKSWNPAPLIVERVFSGIAKAFPFPWAHINASTIFTTATIISVPGTSAWSTEASQPACSGRNGCSGNRADFESARHQNSDSTKYQQSDQLTRVHLTWIENQIEFWIRFGREAEETILDRRRRVLGFTPGSVFAFIRWEANEYGTISSRVDILCAVAPNEPFTTVPFVEPGGELLLHLSGWPKVERVLQAIDAVEAIGINAADAAPDYWRHVHNRLTVGATPRPYTHSRHAAWLLRRRLLP